MKRISAWLLLGALAVAIPAAILVAKEEKSLELLFRAADANEDGRLSSSEVAGMRNGDKNENHRRYFKRLDRNGDGRVTLDEFKRDKKEAASPDRL